VEGVQRNGAAAAASAHLGLAGLRALRTPVPGRPSGSLAIALPSQLGLANETADSSADRDEDEPAITNPVRRMKTGEIYGDDDEADGSMQADDEDDIAVTAPRPAPKRSAAASTEPSTSAMRPPTPLPVSAPASPSVNGARLGYQADLGAAPIGAALLARSSPAKLPWLLVGTLGMAVLGLVAYIVMR